MKRNLCFMAPVFSADIVNGTKVKVTIKNRKGAVKLVAEGIVRHNAHTWLVIEVPGRELGSVTVRAMDVYFGKNKLEVLE